MIISKTLSRSTPSEHGSAFIMILVAVALFAALSFAVSRQGGSGADLSGEKLKLLAADVMDMGNKMADSVAQIRLRKVTVEQVSFQNDTVTGYTNPNCTSNPCKIFAFEGGARDWETTAKDINKGMNWGYTFNLSIQGVGSSAADLIAILPNINLALCNRINRTLKIYDANGIPSEFNGVTANKYVGTIPASPINLTSALVDKQVSGCIKLNSPSGTAFAAGATEPYVYYHVLIAR